MKGLLGPPPALPRLQSEAPSGAPAPTAELGTLCLCVLEHVGSPCSTAKSGWAWAPCHQEGGGIGA